MKLEKEFIFYNERLLGIKHIGLWLEIENGFCKIRKGAESDGATLARDENAVFTWVWHDNAYEDKHLPLSRKVKDLIMMDMLKTEGFRWFRYKWIKKIIKSYNGINMILVYYVMVRLFGWKFEKK